MSQHSQTAFKRGQGFKQECAERDANAALIVRAVVNAHDELVAALRDVTEVAESLAEALPKGVRRHERGAIKRARAALAKAGAK